MEGGMSDASAREPAPPAPRDRTLHALLGALSESSVCVVDRDLRILEFVGGGERWGVSAADVVGRSPDAWLRREEYEPVLALVRQAFATGERRRIECEFALPIGRMWFDVRLQPIRGPGGEVTSVLATSHDVTERHRAEAALRESEQRFQSLADSLPVGVWRTDLASRLVYANRQLWEILDFDPTALAGLDLVALVARVATEQRVDRDEAARLWPEAERAVRERSGVEFEMRWRRGDGSPRWLHVRAAPELDSTGAFIGHVGALSDVSELVRTRQELARHRDHLSELVAERTAALERSHEALRRSERLAAVGTFAAGIAHQINNPLGAILLAAQFTQEIPGERASVEAALRDIATEARRCARIVHGVLEFARGPSGEPRRCDLNEIVRSCARQLASDAAQRGAAIRLHLDARLPPVAGSESALEQVIVNLVHNAIEAEAREIVVGTRTRDEDGVELVVRDDGVGVATEDLDRIFDPLFTTRGATGGTGLGLALARAVVEAHGGSIEVESPNGRGATAVVRLPRARGAPEADPPERLESG
jgi:PAS domain S-box-containing protein